MSVTEAKLNVRLSDKCDRKGAVMELAKLSGVKSIVRLFPKEPDNDELSLIYLATVEADALDRGIAAMIQKHPAVAHVENAPKRKLIKPAKKKQPPK